MLWYIPIEPLEERYTKQWFKWFPEEFKGQGLEYAVLVGRQLSNEIKTGTFLDINATLVYKASQLQQIGQLFYDGRVKDGDVFFVADIEFWGIEAIKYLADLNKVKIRLVGFCHAASYTREDFIAPCEPYAKFHEQAWFNTFDRILVGSHYHKRQMVKLRNADPSKIFVTGNPYAVNETQHKILNKAKRRELRVLHTNRPDSEKRPDLTLDVFQELKKRHPECSFGVTTSRAQWGSGLLRERALCLQDDGIITIYEGLSKEEYLVLVAESLAITGNTIEENFGYCILEAMMLNTFPVVELAYSHPEFLPGRNDLLFTNQLEQITLLSKLISCAGKGVAPVLGFADRFDRVFSEIVQTHLKIKEY